MPDDPYETGLCRWWHLSGASPELLDAEASGRLGAAGVAVDLGAGLGSEIGYLAGRGWRALGVDLSQAALGGARAGHPDVPFLRADVTRLPLRSGAAGLLLDRGCFHYLDAAGRARYAAEAARVLRPGGRLLLRMCLTSAGEPNGLGEHTIRETFGGWQLADLQRLRLASDTRTMPSLIALLIRKDASGTQLN